MPHCDTGLAKTVGGGSGGGGAERRGRDQCRGSSSIARGSQQLTVSVLSPVRRLSPIQHRYGPSFAPLSCAVKLQ